MNTPIPPAPRRAFLCLYLRYTSTYTKPSNSGACLFWDQISHSKITSCVAKNDPQISTWSLCGDNPRIFQNSPVNLVIYPPQIATVSKLAFLEFLCIPVKHIKNQPKSDEWNTVKFGVFNYAIFHICKHSYRSYQLIPKAIIPSKLTFDGYFKCCLKYIYA